MDTDNRYHCVYCEVAIDSGATRIVFGAYVPNDRSQQDVLFTACSWGCLAAEAKKRGEANLKARADGQEREIADAKESLSEGSVLNWTPAGGKPPSPAESGFVAFGLALAIGAGLALVGNQSFVVTNRRTLAASFVPAAAIFDGSGRASWLVGAAMAIWAVMMTMIATMAIREELRHGKFMRDLNPTKKRSAKGGA
jgi:hypothetical protein